MKSYNFSAKSIIVWQFEIEGEHNSTEIYIQFSYN
jgi:hypothetical protein